MPIKITSIKRGNEYQEDPHEAIQIIGWTNEVDGFVSESSREELYDWIKNKGGVAYLLDQRGNIAYVGTAVSKNGTRYVRTFAADVPTDNLLSLPKYKKSSRSERPIRRTRFLSIEIM